MDVLSFFRKFVMQNFRFETKIGDSFLKVNYVRSFSFDFSLKEEGFLLHRCLGSASSRKIISRFIYTYKSSRFSGRFL